MANFIQTKVRYDKTMENGFVKRVTDVYLVDALSFTEAEARIAERVTPCVSGEFEVCAVRKSNVDEVLCCESEQADKFFKAKVAFLSVDERTGAEKRTPYHVVVLHESLDGALRMLHEKLKEGVSDYVVLKIEESNIADIYRHEG